MAKPEGSTTVVISKALHRRMTVVAKRLQAATPKWSTRSSAYAAIIQAGIDTLKAAK